MIVDARVTLKSGGKSVLVEVDGPTHFLEDTRTGERRVNGATQLKHWRLRRRAEAFVAISDREWNQAHPSQSRSDTTHPDQCAFLSRVLLNTLQLAAASAPPTRIL